MVKGVETVRSVRASNVKHCARVVTKRSGLTHFQKGILENNGVRPLNHQSSSMLDSRSMNSYHGKRKFREKERLVEVLEFNFEIHLHYLKPRIISLKGVG